MPEAWWWRTTWSYPDWMGVEWRDGRLNLAELPPPTYSFRGTGGTSALWWSRQRDRFRVLAQFTLDHDRMPGTRTVALSMPKLELAGTIRAYSGHSATFDEPSLAASLRLRQEASLGGRAPAIREETTELFRIRDQSHVVEERSFSADRPLWFPGLTLVLDGSDDDLLVNLDVELAMSREGSGRFLFYPREGDWRFWLHVPQWDIAEERLI